MAHGKPCPWVVVQLLCPEPAGVESPQPVRVRPSPEDKGAPSSCPPSSAKLVPSRTSCGDGNASVCSVQYSGHGPHAATESLKCGQCGWRPTCFIVRHCNSFKTELKPPHEAPATREHSSGAPWPQRRHPCSGRGPRLGIPAPRTPPPQAPLNVDPVRAQLSLRLCYFTADGSCPPSRIEGQGRGQRPEREGHVPQAARLTADGGAGTQTFRSPDPPLPGSFHHPVGQMGKPEGSWEGPG